MRPHGGYAVHRSNGHVSMHAVNGGRECGEPVQCAPARSASFARSLRSIQSRRCFVRSHYLHHPNLRGEAAK